MRVYGIFFSVLILAVAAYVYFGRSLSYANLEKAIAIAKEEEFTQAEVILRKIVESDPSSDEALLATKWLDAYGQCTTAHVAAVGAFRHALRKQEDDNGVNLARRKVQDATRELLDSKEVAEVQQGLLRMGAALGDVDVGGGDPTGRKRVAKAEMDLGIARSELQRLESSNFANDWLPVLSKGPRQAAWDAVKFLKQAEGMDAFVKSASVAEELCRRLQTM